MGEAVQGREGIEVAGKFLRGSEAGKCHGGEAWESGANQVRNVEEEDEELNS